MFGPGGDSHGNPCNLTTADWVLWSVLVGNFAEAERLIDEHEKRLQADSSVGRARP